MRSFKARLKIVGVNPYVSVPEDILADLHAKAGKEKGPIPIHGKVNGADYTQTLVRFAGEWRLYVNMKMLKDSPKRIGEELTISIDFDRKDRTLEIHTKLQEALEKDTAAKQTFLSLPLSLQNEIIRYICRLKSEDKVDENIIRAIDFLNGKGRFVGRSLKS